MSSNDEHTHRVRMHLDFSVGAYEKLQRLRLSTNATTEAEVIQKALVLYESKVLTAVNRRAIARTTPIGG